MSRPRLCSCVPRSPRASSPSAGHFDHTFIKGMVFAKELVRRLYPSPYHALPLLLSVVGRILKMSYWPPLMTHRRKSEIKDQNCLFCVLRGLKNKITCWVHGGEVLLLSWPGWGALNRKLVPLSTQSQLSSACISSISAASVDTDISMTRERQSNYPSLGMNGLCPNPF